MEAPASARYLRLPRVHAAANAVPRRAGWRKTGVTTIRLPGASWRACWTTAACGARFSMRVASSEAWHSGLIGKQTPSACVVSGRPRLNSAKLCAVPTAISTAGATVGRALESSTRKRCTPGIGPSSGTPKAAAGARSSRRSTRMCAGRRSAGWRELGVAERTGRARVGAWPHGRCQVSSNGLLEGGLLVGITGDCIQVSGVNRSLDS